MGGLRVGLEIQASPMSVVSAMATLPWMTPEQIRLDNERTLLLLSTSFEDAAEACAYAERRVHKSALGMGLELRVLSSEAFPPPGDRRRRLALDRRQPGADASA